MKKQASPLSPPKAKKKNFFHKKFGDKILDPYYWLRTRDSKEVLDYLKAENQYAQSRLKALKALKNKLFQEMKSRLPEKQDQEPVSIGEYFYYLTWEKEKDYPLHKRKKKSEDKEEVILDENSLPTKTGYLDVASALVSPDHKILAYAKDEQGREFYNIYFKNLKTGQQSDVFVSSVTSDFVWANDNKTIFYVQQDKETLRAFQVYRFDRETGKKQLVFEEEDPKFSVFLSKSLSQEKILICAQSSQTTEYHYLSADQPGEDFVLFCKREPQHEYHLDCGEGIFYILSNADKAFNFKLMKVPEEPKNLETATRQQEKQNGRYPYKTWQEMIPHRPEVYVENYEVFKKVIVLNVRSQGQQEIEILNKRDLKLSKVLFQEKIYSVDIGDNEEYESFFVRLNYQSLTQPPKVYDYSLSEKKLNFKSQVQVRGGFFSENYVSQQEYATSKDGSKIPISLVYRKNIRPSSSSPLLLYAYGSYGSSADPGFRSSVLSLLDRGFIYAIAHVRGGSEKGKRWYEGGKLLHKKNTFSDFICCAEHLIVKSYTSSSHLYIMGGSAGGLLIGAALNKRPDLFHAAVVAVPFVDCLTTMLDESIPLSTGEYEEWGNPNEKKYYDYIKSYSPYNNIKKTDYPHLFIYTGYHDPRVQYWEPAKWAAKLRDYKTDKNLLLLLTNMDSGHFGSTGRLEALKLCALYYAFLVGIEQSLIES